MYKRQAKALLGADLSTSELDPEEAEADAEEEEEEEEEEEPLATLDDEAEGPEA